MIENRETKAESQVRTPVLCSQCLSNEGLRRAASKLHSNLEDVCPRCGNRGGAKLDIEAVVDLFRRFYCAGSEAAAYLPPIFRDNGIEDEDIQFDKSAQGDYELLKGASGLSIRRYSPHLRNLGLTDLRHRIDEALRTDPVTATEEIAARLRQDLKALLDAGTELELTPETSLFRARISPERPLDDTQYDSPPIEKSVPNRVAGPGRQVLCGALDIETCLIEIRPSLDDLVHHRVFAATLKPRESLRLLDFTALKPGLPETEFTLGAFFEPNRNSYHLTQMLSTLAEQRGYNGLVYRSAFGCISGVLDSWKNVAVFGAPIAEGKLTVKSINRILTRSVVNSFDLGPVWDDERQGNHLAPFLKGWLNRANR